MNNPSSQPFDWKNYQTAFPPLPHSGECWRLTIGADWAPIRRFAAPMAEAPATVYGDLLPLFANSDLNVFNVEAVLCDPTLSAIPKDGPPLLADKGSAAALNAAHCHLACLANNHAMDFGAEGLRQTLDALHRAGIATVGAGMDSETIRTPAIVTVKGVRVAIINCADGEAGRSLRGEPGVHGLDTGAEMLRIQALRRDALADAIVVIYHGGREHTPVPPPYAVQSMRLLAEAGADAVIAHHPHVPQGVEIYKGVPIAYSLGNFIFWQQNDLYFRHTGYLVHLDFSGGKLRALQLSPYNITPEGLRLMNSAEKAAFTTHMQRASEPLHSDAAIDACWAAFADTHDLSAFCAIFAEGMPRVANAAAASACAATDDNAQGAGATTDNNTQATAATINGDAAPAKSAQGASTTLSAGAATEAMRLHNRFLTPAHSLLACEILERHAKGQRGTAPAWANELVRLWLEEKNT